MVPQVPQKRTPSFNSKGVMMCRGLEAAPGSWPDGLFVRNVAGSAVEFPTLESSVISKMWLLKSLSR